MRDSALLYVNGRRIDLRGPAAFAPLSTLLRDDLALTGTKVVCAEGDCGACAVLVGRPHAGRLAYHPVTSCIATAAQFDGAHVVTIEGLSRADGQLNPVQRAMVTHHGAQCGYCTPGIVVTLCGLFDRDPAATADAARAALVGNLCRCTGYVSILDAAAHVDPAQLQPLDQRFPPAPILDDLAQAAKDDLLLTDGTRKFFKPATLPAALKFKSDHPACAVIAGGTDLGVYANKDLRHHDVTLSLAAVREFHELRTTDDEWHVGANVTLRQLEQAAKSDFPALAPMLARHGSPLIRNAATLAGNVANASSIGDALPGLYVLDAQIELASQAGPRTVNVNDFYTGYKQTALRPDELITAIRIPKPPTDDVLRLYKVSKRHDLDISTFTAALRVTLDPATNRVTRARLAAGGVAPTVVRLPRTEAFLSDRPFDAPTLTQAGRLAREEITPITDVRGTADYRRQLLENTFTRFFHETAGEARTEPRVNAGERG